MRRILIITILSIIALSSFAEPSDTLVLKVNLIIIQKSDGSGNFSSKDSLHIEYFNKSFDRLNELYAFKRNHFPDSSCLKDHTYKDSGIRFYLNKTLEIKDDSLWDNDQDKNWSRCPNRKRWYLLKLQKHLDSIIPPSEQGINLYLTVSNTDLQKVFSKADTIEANFSQVACSMFPSQDTSDFSAVHYPNAYLKYLFMQQFPYKWGIGTLGRGMAHELGHSLGLTHTKSCNNIMDGAGSVKRKNLNDNQVQKARKNIQNTNLKKYLKK